MNYLYLDIETLPTNDGFVMAEIEDGIKPPANISKPETLDKWDAEAKPALVKEAIGKTALSGAWGSVCCIAFAWGDSEPTSLVRDGHGEGALLTDAFAKMQAAKPQFGMNAIVGHNVANFDIRFIWQRCFVLGVRVPGWFPRDPKPWSREINDTMTMWSGARDFISLDKLCRAMGLRGKGNMNGADVAQAWVEGRFEDIKTYCQDDVERVRAVHRKMLVTLGE